MTTTTLFPNAPDVTAQDYCVFGVATCFISEEGEVSEVQVIEPIPSSALEAILKGVPTSYNIACARTLGDIFADGQLTPPADFPENAQFAENFTQRAVSAARTYQYRPEAQTHIPLGGVYKEFNYSLERKRILNAKNIVSTEDNVKQHSYTHEVL